MSEIATTRLSIDTVGGAGAASGSGTTPALNGFLLDIYFDYHASAPATTDVTVSYATRGGTILTLTDSATDALKAPRQAGVDASNTALGANEFWPLDQPLTVAVAQCDALTAALTVVIRYLGV